ncbi:MFS transporter, partial [Bacillus subtilis]|nr:MFS transporter [Bacillus subtilis]
ELPVAATYINEITRAHGRGRFVLLYEIVFPIGLLVSMALGAWLVPRFGWEIMYFVGGLPLILSLVLTHLVPESPRWLEHAGRHAEADTVMHSIEAKVMRSAGVTTLPPPSRLAEPAAARGRGALREIWSGVYRRRTVMVWLLWFFALL